MNAVKTTVTELGDSRVRVEAEAHANQPYSDTFAEALQHYADLRSRTVKIGRAHV